ncbi:MAG TPA: sulfite exporter TauE/SafE family protein [Kiloniellales bacterium]|nr:sulfite exporter TauE/SafE family protein [Kiloniellales bacterium]
MLAELFTWELGWAAGVVTLAAVVRGFSGFGSALILTPALSMIYAPEIAVPLVIVVEAALSVQMLPLGWKAAEHRQVAFLSVMAVIAIPFGTWALIAVDPTMLRWVISIGILLFLLALLAGWRRKGEATRFGIAVTGVLAGLMNGAAGIPGPPVLLYYLGGGTTAKQLRANVILFFFVLDCATLPWMAIQGLITVRILLIAALLLPTAVLGVFAGVRLFPLASERLFRLIAFGIIGAVAVVSLPIG